MKKNPSKGPPLFSIITPSFNRATFISQAIESVLHQNYPNVEHIIIDGGSTDGTLEVIKKYPHLRVVSGPDKGMYDALNKGLGMARGEIIGFLNTDDLYTEGSFGGVLDLFKRNRTDAVAGQAILFSRNRDNTESVIHQIRILTEERLWRELIYSNPGFNAWFFNRRVFEKIGTFDTSYRMSGDRDFLFKFLLSGLNFEFLEQTVYGYLAHEDSLTFSRNPSYIFQLGDENLRLVEHYLDLVPGNARLEMQRQRTRTSISMVARHLRLGAYKKALYYTRLGCSYDVLWPVKFVFGLFRGMFREIERKFGIYPPF